MFATKPKTFLITGFSALLVFIACKKNADSTGTTDPAVSAVLNLPATPLNYANIVQPAYLAGPLLPAR